MVIAVDFDHTIVHGDKPIEGAKDAINMLREAGHKIVIFSCNNESWIRKVLDYNDIRYDKIWTPEDGGKVIADLYIDDRALQFKGDWTETLSDISKIAYKHNAGLW